MALHLLIVASLVSGTVFEPLVQDPHLGETAATEKPPWEFSGTAFYSDPPGSEDARTTAILYGDRGPLHLELRYNYEDLDTASAFFGWAFSGGDSLAYTVTPMVGVVGGDTDGVAPGLLLDVAWRRFAWYVESEYLFDAHDSSDDFFYSWSTLTYAFTDWLSAGTVAERNKVVDTDFEVQWGLALELQLKRIGVAVYTYNLGDDDDYTVVSLGASV